MSWLATWFIFELIVVWAAPDLNELQAFKNESLQMVIDKTFTFRRVFHKKFHHIQVFEVRYEQLKWKRKRYPFTASSFRFHTPDFYEKTQNKCEFLIDCKTSLHAQCAICKFTKSALP